MLLGHFVGDFLLQFNKIHALKFKHGWGLLLHVLIVVGCLSAFCWPYLGQRNVWIFLVFVGTTHYVQDWAKIKFTGKTKRNLFFFLIDQAFHVLFISLIFATSLKDIGPPFNKDGNALFNAYNNNFLILYFIALIIVSYMAHYIILIVKTDYLKGESTVSAFEKRYGFMERIILFSALLSGGLWLVSVPLVLILRPLLFKTLKDKLNISDRFASPAEILLSGSAVILTGFIFYTII